LKYLEFEDVYKHFCNKDTKLDVLHNISFSVDEGEIVAITGPSGSGKTTILNIISGLIKPSSGKVTVHGNIGYMFQRDHLFEWKNIYDNVMLGLEIQKNKTEENIKSVERMLKIYGLWDFRNAYPKELSGGMRQRVALIRTLAVNPDILLLDEPFSSLDYQTKLIVSQDIYNIIKNEKKTTIIVSHDISEAISLANRVIVLSKRPATIKNTFNIEFENLSPIKKRQDKRFQIYFEKIWEAINNNG
jgi:NitT/TauT family transport system ATP-binding protein